MYVGKPSATDDPEIPEDEIPEDVYKGEEDELRPAAPYEVRTSREGGIIIAVPDMPQQELNGQRTSSCFQNSEVEEGRRGVKLAVTDRWMGYIRK